MRARHGWNEENLSEVPAVELLTTIGYTYVAPEVMEVERGGSFRDVVVAPRLRKALQRLNPWINETNLERAIKDVAGAHGTSLLETNEAVYTTLTSGKSLEQNLGDGKKSHTIRYFDFDNPANNEFVVTRQFTVRGTKKNIRTDVLVLVNGIPIVLIENKSPTLGDKWLDESLKQVHRYQELGDKWQGEGAPHLFHTVQLIVLACGQNARYGTVATPGRYYSEWKATYPHDETALQTRAGKPLTKQDVLLHGMLAPANLLDIIRNFVVFETDSGRTVRKVCRYQQFVAVNRAIDRAKSAKRATDRGGVVWHTQGSGKSLTMMWLAAKLRRDPALDNPTLVIATDRRDLDKQISDTFVACGFPNPERAASVRDLRRLLANATGKTILTTVQKFQELSLTPAAERSKEKRARRETHPELCGDANVFVLADEAHRTQYGGLAANMRAALPNACFFGFTGTPIDKNDKSTLSTFGPYIDTYTIEQAVADEATVPIFYESRLPAVRILGASLDVLFDRVFADRSDEEREAIKKKYGNEAAIAAAPRRIEMICLDVIEHYQNAIRPNGFKAQIVASSREAAAEYKRQLDRLNGPPSALIISTGHNDPAPLVNAAVPKDKLDGVIKSFKESSKPEILIVCDMLLTGFDAPVEQVMYLDSPLREHTLLQAIARVNRLADKKKYGLIVDYWGVSEALQEALAVFSPSDIAGAAAPKSDELPRLQARHAAAMRFFARLPARDRDDLPTCVRVLEAEDVRAEFDAAFRAFGQSMDMMLPDPQALRYRDDLRWLGKIRAACGATFHDDRLQIGDCGEKVRKLIEEAIVADGVEVLVKEISIFSADFEAKIEALKTDEARATEMEHALRHEIHVKMDEDPVFYTSLRQRLEELVADKRARRIDSAQYLLGLQAETKVARDRGETAQRMGLSQLGFAMFGEFGGGAAGAEEREALVERAKLIEEAISPLLDVVDWHKKDDVQREIRRVIKRHLKASNESSERADELAAAIVDRAKAQRGRK